LAQDTLTVIVIALLVSFIFSETFHRLKYPRVIGQILTGIILGLPAVAILFSSQALSDIAFLSDIGILFLLLITGMKVDLKKMKSSSKATVITSIFGFFVPFVLGIATMKIIGYDNITAFVVGSCLSLTAEGTNIQVLNDMKALNTKVGLVILGAGIIDDIFEILLLSGLLVLVQKTTEGLVYIPIELIVFIAITLATYKFFPFFLRNVQKERSRISTMSFIIVFGLLIAVISQKLGLGPIIGAFIAGAILRLTDKKDSEFQEDLKELEAITFALIVPFFFINIGLNFDFSSIPGHYWIIVLIVIIATAGKIGGALLAKPFTKMSFKQMHLVGWGINSRGLMELVIAEIAYANKLIPIEIYTGVVVMAILTTLAFPFAFKFFLMKGRKILA